jgi:hypothetical protein
MALNKKFKRKIMKKTISLLIGALIATNQAAYGENCRPAYCPINPNPYYNGYCPNVQNQDSAIITFNINPYDYIELHDHSIEFSNCPLVTNACDSPNPAFQTTCVTSSFSAATNGASCNTPKKIVGQLDAPMPCCTAFVVRVHTPSTSCYYNGCDFDYENPYGCQTPGFCGDCPDATNLSDGTPQDLLSCITCNFRDCDIPIDYLFGADVCATPGSFQRTFTISFVDQAASDCYGNGCPFPN